MSWSDSGSPPVEPTQTPCTVFFGRSTLVGRSLVPALLNTSHWTVRLVDLLPPPNPIEPDRCDYIRLDPSDRVHLRSAVDGAAAVFLIDPVAAAVSVVESPRSTAGILRVHTIAVAGAKNVVAACRAAGVRRLVYCGVADVVADGRGEIVNGDESLPYPEKFGDVFTEMRMQVEMLVLRANGEGGLLTCALRPVNLFGPGDPSFVNFVLQEARSGRAKFLVGNGKNMCDFTYVENVVRANIFAEHALRKPTASVAGKPFFITNDEPIELCELINITLDGLDCRRPLIRLPAILAWLFGMLVKLVGEKLGISPNSILSPGSNAFMCTKTFDCSKAKMFIGYRPTESMEDAIELTVKPFLYLAQGTSSSQEQDLTRTSKADKLLGSGVVADILLWRDERRTFAFVAMLFILFYWFFLSGTTFVASSAKFLWVISVALYFHGVLPSPIFGINFEKISLSYFEISESIVKRLFFGLASLWNKGVSTLRLLARGEDWDALIKAAGFLLLVKMLLYIPIPVLIGLGLICLFTFFIVYEQCEEEIDNLVTVAADGFGNVKDQFIAKIPKALVINE